MFYIDCRFAVKLEECEQDKQRIVCRLLHAAWDGIILILIYHFAHSLSAYFIWRQTWLCTTSFLILETSDKIKCDEDYDKRKCNKWVEAVGNESGILLLF